jgi:hypothetical protein
LHFRKHCNQAREKCHGEIPEGQLHLVPWSLNNQYAPRITYELRGNIEQLFRWGWTIPQVFDMHIKQQILTGGADCPFNNPNPLPWSLKGPKDDSIDKKELRNIKVKVDKETYKYHTNDQQSVQIWINEHEQFVLLHQQYIIGPPEQDFMFVLQSKWQLSCMVHYSHNKPIAMDNTFATTKYDVSFFRTFLLFSSLRFC